MHESYDPNARLTAAIERLSVNTETQTQWLKSHLDCASKQDLKAAKLEILQAIGSSVDPKKVQELAQETKKLETAVAANQPIAGS